MKTHRKVEIFSAGCPLCEEAVRLVQEIACSSCETTIVHLMSDPEGAGRARALGVRSLPAVAIDGKLAACCSGGGVDETSLRSAGVGQTR